MCIYLFVHGIKHLAINIFCQINTFPLVTQCSSMDQAVSLAARSIQFESSFLSLQGKPKHMTWRGTPSPHISTVPIDSPSTERGSPPWRTMPHYRAVTALVPTITGMADHVSGRVRRAICGQVHSGTRLTNLPYFSACI
jgi:hypothetical protein